jgi:hypothetical protein
LSAVETAALTAVLVRDGKAFSNYVAVVLDSAERDASSVQSTFSSIQPPDRAQDDLRDRLGARLGDADDSIMKMLIAARRHDWPAVLAAANDLPKLARDLKKYAALPA